MKIYRLLPVLALESIKNLGPDHHIILGSAFVTAVEEKDISTDGILNFKSVRIYRERLLDFLLGIGF